MLIQCRECELQVSNLAEFCPHCGCPVLHEENDGKNKRRKRVKRNSGRRRLPNGFGQISEIKDRNLRNPYRVMVSVGKAANGRPVCRPQEMGLIELEYSTMWTQTGVTAILS